MNDRLENFKGFWLSQVVLLEVNIELKDELVYVLIM